MSRTLAGIALTAVLGTGAGLALPTPPTTNPATRLAQLARTCITDEATLQLAVAIALGEGGGDPNAIGDTTITDGTWGPSYGDWQIRSLYAQKGTGGTRDADTLLDPATNARSMCAISLNGTNWQPWSAYTTGAYQAHMGEALVAARQAAGQPAPAPGPATVQTATAKRATLGDRLDRIYQDAGDTLDKACGAVHRTDTPTLDATCQAATRAVFGASVSADASAKSAPNEPQISSSGGDAVCPVPGVQRDPTGEWGQPRGGGTRPHMGIDLFAPPGTPIQAPTDGTITQVVNDEAAGGLGGLNVVIRDADGAEIYFAHNSDNTVVVGQHVTAGQTIAHVGDTGDARGGPTHAHTQYYPPGQTSPADPTALINALCGPPEIKP